MAKPRKHWITARQAPLVELLIDDEASLDGIDLTIRELARQTGVPARVLATAIEAR